MGLLGRQPGWEGVASCILVARGQIQNLRMCDQGVSRNGAEGRTTERAQGSMGARADPVAGALGLQILTRSPLSPLV